MGVESGGGGFVGGAVVESSFEQRLYSRRGLSTVFGRHCGSMFPEKVQNPTHFGFEVAGYEVRENSCSFRDEFVPCLYGGCVVLETRTAFVLDSRACMVKDEILGPFWDAMLARQAATGIA